MTTASNHVSIAWDFRNHFWIIAPIETNSHRIALGHPGLDNRRCGSRRSSTNSSFLHGSAAQRGGGRVDADFSAGGVDC